MLAKFILPFFSKIFIEKTFQRVLKFSGLREGYHITLKNNNYFVLVKQAAYKSRLLNSQEINLKHKKILYIRQKEGIPSYLWESLLVSIRIIVITSVISGLLTFYYITRVFGLRIYPIVYLKAIEFLGPTFIKLGQWMSTRRDLYPEELCLCLSRLQRSTSAHSWYYTKHLLKANYGSNWNQLFVEFEQLPIGSGCCAQVHRAIVNLNYTSPKLRGDTNVGVLIDSKLQSFFISVIRCVVIRA